MKYYYIVFLCLLFVIVYVRAGFSTTSQASSVYIVRGEVCYRNCFAFLKRIMCFKYLTFVIIKSLCRECVEQEGVSERVCVCVSPARAGTITTVKYLKHKKRLKTIFLGKQH
jgi:hypothetical protein